MNDPMVVWTKYNHVGADVQPKIPQILDVVGVGDSLTKLGAEVEVADFAVVIVVGLETVCERWVSVEVFDQYDTFTRRLRQCDAVVVVNRRRGPGPPNAVATCEGSISCRSRCGVAASDHCMNGNMSFSSAELISLGLVCPR